MLMPNNCGIVVQAKMPAATDGLAPAVSGAMANATSVAKNKLISTRLNETLFFMLLIELCLKKLSLNY
ncbi:MAG: hypothetical protein BGO32_08665 [Bacteroidetes bacterium 37-13]|nr:MAG: hypothetical protein BGO32_08665 [Bacteroidetes bacterium 37-13]